MTGVRDRRCDAPGAKCVIERRNRIPSLYGLRPDVLPDGVIHEVRMYL